MGRVPDHASLERAMSKSKIANPAEPAPDAVRFRYEFTVNHVRAAILEWAKKHVPNFPEDVSPNEVVFDTEYDSMEETNTLCGVSISRQVIPDTKV